MEQRREATWRDLGGSGDEGSESASLRSGHDGSERYQHLGRRQHTGDDPHVRHDLADLCPEHCNDPVELFDCIRLKLGVAVLQERDQARCLKVRERALADACKVEGQQADVPALLRATAIV